MAAVEIDAELILEPDLRQVEAAARRHREPEVRSIVSVA